MPALKAQNARGCEDHEQIEDGATSHAEGNAHEGEKDID